MDATTSVVNGKYIIDCGGLPDDDGADVLSTWGPAVHCAGSDTCHRPDHQRRRSM